jgi:hypothetical protein
MTIPEPRIVITRLPTLSIGFQPIALRQRVLHPPVVHSGTNAPYVNAALFAFATRHPQSLNRRRIKRLRAVPTSAEHRVTSGAVLTRRAFARISL